jgi:folate-dependent phosphoribosylglycinamide formyltransferase PurN
MQVSAYYDEGPIIDETRVFVEPGDTPESLFNRVQVVEKDNLPSVIGRVLDSRGLYGYS